MSDALERELHAAFASGLADISPEITARVRATDYGPAQHRRRPIAVAGSAAAVLTASVAAVLLLLSSGTPDAFAGWTAMPASVSGSALRQAEAVCGHVQPSKVLASEARGPYVAIVYERASSPWECVSQGKDVFLNRTTPDPPGAFANPGTGKVTLPVITARTAHGLADKLNVLQQRLLKLGEHVHQYSRGQQRAVGMEKALERQIFDENTGPDSLTAVSGAVGTGVTGVTLVLDDGKRVDATVGNNWYLAWWPGVSTHNAYPVSILVSTATGTAPANFTRTRLTGLFRPCLSHTHCTYIPASIKLIPGLAPQLRQRFSLFRTTPPASAQTISQLRSGPGAGIWTAGAGADLKQLRAVSFGHLGTIVVIPGSGGVCLEVAPGGGGACNPSLQTAVQGVILSSYSRNPDGSGVYSIAGLVPDGNRIVTVYFPSGRTVRLHVRNNLVFAKFSQGPDRISYAVPHRTITTGFPISRHR